MTISELLLPEVKHEVSLSETFIKRIPEDKLDWRPHEKSMTLGQLMSHLAEIPSWITATLAVDEMDMTGYKTPVEDSIASALASLKSNCDEACKLIEAADDAEYDKTWTMKQGDQVLMAMPKYQTLRSMVLNQMPHHRAQLGVFLRLLEQSVPATYGPSADEQ